MKIVILKDELPGSDSKWKLACDKKNLDYEVVDLATQNWYEKILMLKPDILLLKPSGLTTPYKEMFDERLSILVNEKKTVLLSVTQRGQNLREQKVLFLLVKS